MMEKKRILLVDDEVSFTRLVKLEVEEAGGYEVRIVNRAMEALAAAKAFKPDLIVLDIIMPKLDGGMVAFQLMREKTLERVPIVFLTAIVSKEDLGTQTRVVAGNPFIAKPVSTEDLISCIERYLSEPVSH